MPNLEESQQTEETISDGDIEVSLEGDGPTASIWWRYQSHAGGNGEWQNSGLQAADVVGGWQNGVNVIRAVRTQCDL